MPEYQEDSEWMLLRVVGGGSGGAWLSKAKSKEREGPLFLCLPIFLFGHALNTRRVQMSYKTDGYAH